MAYHLAFFASVNPAAYAFGVLFVAQAFVIFREGVWKAELDFRPRRNWRGAAGALLLAYALLLYPALGYVLGHRYPAAPTFGLPCPTTLFTFGLLAWSERRVSYRLLFIPTLWAASGVVAAVQWGMYEDLMLLPAAGVGIRTTAGRGDKVAARA